MSRMRAKWRYQMTARMIAGVLGVLVSLACVCVAVAQTITECQAESNRQAQAAHEQYEREMRACNKAPACLQSCYDRWIVASNNAMRAAAQCGARIPAQTSPQLKELPPKPAPIGLPENPDVCDKLRTRLTTVAVNQYNNVVQTCQSPECIKAALNTWKQADAAAEQKYNACRANLQAAKGPLKGDVQQKVEVPNGPLRGGSVYNPDYGQGLPAMTGQVPYQGTNLYVTLARGHLVGQGIEGPMQFYSAPPRFIGRASGMITAADTFTITKLWDMQGREVDPVQPIVVPLRPVK